METSDSKILRSACFTGHRPAKFPFDTENKTYLSTFLSNVYLLTFEAVTKRNIDTFYCGMQVGMDIWAGKIVLEQKKTVFKDRNVNLICVAPFEDEIVRRTGQDLTDYLCLQEGCDKFIALNKSFNRYCYYQRNQYMVENSGYVIAALSKQRSGTELTINYAKKLGRDIHVIDLDKFAAEHGFAPKK